MDKDWRESQSNTITHEQFDAATVERLLSWLYDGSYSLRSAPKQACVRDSVLLNHMGKIIEIPDDDSGDHQATSDRVADHLVQHVYVYAIADFYNVSSLVEHAASKFKHLLGCPIRGNSMMRVIEATCSNTRQEDMYLREPLTSKVAQRIHQLRSDDSFSQALAAGNLPQEFLGHVLSRVSANQEEHHEKLQDLLEKEKKARSDAEYKSSILQHRLANLQNTLASMNTACRNTGCSARFDKLTFEPCGTEGWQVRCAQCRCRM